MNSKSYDLVIIGAGPAGLTAALYAGRFRLNAIVLEKMNPGGQIVLSETIENYPGFPGGINTFDLIEKFKKQAEEVGVNIENREVLEIKFVQENNRIAYEIITSEGKLTSKSVILATGASFKKLGVPGEDKFAARGVSYCGTCDGPLFKNKDIVVVGGGDRAMEEVIYLSNYASRIFMVHRRDAFRASKILEEKAQGNPKINFVLNSVIENISGDDKVSHVVIKDVKTGELKNISCQGVFIFVGIEPNTGYLKNLLEINEKGFIITRSGVLTSREGIFACGDCCDKILYQVVTACGEGAAACDAAHKYLLNL